MNINQAKQPCAAARLARSDSARLAIEMDGISTFDHGGTGEMRDDPWPLCQTTNLSDKESVGQARDHKTGAS